MDKHGWMLKKGNILKSWHRRFCILSPKEQIIQYYNNLPDNNKKPRGTIQLFDVTTESQGTSSDGYCTIYIFSLYSKRVKYVFACYTEEDRHEWITAINLVSHMGKMVLTRSSFETIDEYPKSSCGLVSPAESNASNIIEEVTEELIRLNSDCEDLARGQLGEVSNAKWEIKVSLKAAREDFQHMFADLRELSNELSEEENILRQQLDEINNDTSVLDVFSRKSLRLQWDMVRTVSKGSTSNAVARSISKYGDATSEPYSDFIKLIREAFPDEGRLSNEEEYDLMDVYEMYNEYYTKVHLPKASILEKYKAERIHTWKQLVRVVTQKKATASQILELSQIMDHIDIVMKKGDVKNTAGVIEDSPKAFRRQWERVAEHINTLVQLREEQSGTQSSLADTLKSREMLRGWSNVLAKPI